MTKAGVLARQEKKRVLVAEGESIVRYGLSQFINLQPDLEVVGEKGNGNGLLEEIVSKQPDLLIIDLFLNSISIFQLLEAISTQSPRVAILVLSRYDEFLYAPRVLRLGAKGYLKKEASTDQMLAAMRHVLRGDIFVSERLREVWLDSFLGTSSNVSSSPLDRLSDRELEVFHLLGNGYSTAEMATILHRSVKTIESHRSQMKKKLKVQTATQLIRQAVLWKTEGAPAC